MKTNNKEEYFIKNYYNYILNLSKYYYKKHKLSRSIIDFNDILNETIITILLKYRKGIIVNKSYISQIVHNKTVDMIRKDIIQSKTKPIFLELYNDCNCEGFFYDPYYHIDNSLLADKILNIVYYSNMFNFIDKLSFYLSYYQDMSHMQISINLGVCQSCITYKINRIKTYLKNILNIGIK